jgi:hypothetical protein
MAEKEKKILNPIINKVICKISGAVFSSAQDVLDETMSENPRARKFVKKIVNLCEDMVMDEFPVNRQLLPTQKKEELEGPATSEKTQEYMGSEQGTNVSQQQRYADNGE